MQTFLRRNHENHSWRIENVKSLWVMGAQIANQYAQSKLNGSHHEILNALPSREGEGLFMWIVTDIEKWVYH